MIQTPTNNQEALEPIPAVDGRNTKPTAQEIRAKVYKIILRIASLLLLAHGLINLYDEIIQIFFVFPKLPDLFAQLNYSETLFEGIYKRSIIISATAFIQTIYALVLITKHKHLDHKVHLFSAFALLISSILILRGSPKIDLEHLSDLPKPPTFERLILEPLFNR